MNGSQVTQINGLHRCMSQKIVFCSNPIICVISVPIASKILTHLLDSFVEYVILYEPSQTA